jgi:hypothetical protein
MLREDLEDAGLVHANYGRKTDEVDADEDDMEFTERAAGPGKAVANSVFDMARATGADELDEDLIGDDAPLPTVGKKASHPERRTKDTPAQRMQEHFRELMYDEKATFIQMVWADMRPIAEELGLPGLINTDVTSKAISKASKARAKA